MILFLISYFISAKILIQETNSIKGLKQYQIQVRDLINQQNQQFRLYARLTKKYYKSNIVLALCDNSNATNILYNKSLIRDQIVNHGYECIFDNIAYLYNLEQQLLIVQNTFELDYVLNDFGIQMTQRDLINFSVYSDELSSYDIIIESQQSNQCNEDYCNGKCSMEVCLCGFDNGCFLDPKPINNTFTSSLQYGQLIFSFDLSQFPNYLSISVDSNSTIWLTYSFSYIDNHISQFGNMTVQIIPGQSDLIFITEKLQYYYQYINQSSQKFNLSLQPQLLLLLENRNANILKFEIDIFLQYAEENNTSIIYFTLGGFAIMFIIVVLIVLFYKFNKNKRRIRTHLVLIDKYMPTKQYYKILEELPGLKTENVCSICLQQFKQEDYIRMTLCIHIYHQSCIDQWIRAEKQNCPTCRTVIKIQKSTQYEQNEIIAKRVAYLKQCNPSNFQEHQAI